ncbi:MAG: SPOR domain-containing protein [Prevotella sp.]|jgi:cell division protein FtsN|nr:SPOR domain-containing protein [Prevotella sp.]MEE0336644.1 SPOR domain-containing protein [Prevotella sp.]
MKKSLMLCAGLCLAMAMASCSGSKESAYKKAYEKAKAQEAQQTEVAAPQEEAPVVTPLVEKPATQTTVIDNTDNATVRTEAVTLVDGNGLKDFSVVVGSFSLKSNALGLQQRLKNQGHPAQVAYNPSINYYRVIVSTFDNKASAVQSRNQFRATYPDAWLLLKK